MKRKRSSWLILASLIIVGLLTVIGVLVMYERDNIKSKAATAKLKQELAQYPEITLYKEPWWDKGELHVWIEIKDRGTVIFWYNEGTINGFLKFGDYSPDVNCVAANKEYSTFFNIAKGHKLGTLFPYEINTISDIMMYYNQTISILSTLPQNPQSGIQFTDSFKDQTATCVLFVNG